MPLRPDLHYRPPSPEKIEHLAQLLKIIENPPTTSSQPAAIQEFNRVSQREYVATDFDYYGAMDTETFLEQAACPPPHRVSDITRDELVEMVRRILGAATEAEGSYYMELFDAQFTLPRASALLYYPPDSETRVGGWEPTPEKVVELALAHKPIAL